MVGFAGVIASFFLIWSLKELIILIFAGVIISMALCTLTGKIKNLVSLPRQICLLIALTSVLLILCIFFIEISKVKIVSNILDSYPIRNVI